MNFESWFSEICPEVRVASAQAVLRLSEQGATLPFIARYRKEQTGNLDEVGIQKALDAKEKWDQLVKRQAYILGEIEKQGKLTPELKTKIETCFRSELLEDLYLPYKQKRKTKATLAREAGLLPLADWIWNCGHGAETPHPGQTLEIWAFTFRNEAKGIAEATGAIQGAQDILVERLSESDSLRSVVREALLKKGVRAHGKGREGKAQQQV